MNTSQAQRFTSMVSFLVFVICDLLSHGHKCIDTPQNCIAIADKRLLLEAEIYSFEGKVAQANTSHTAAITTSHSSRFIHEEGLCLEMAGLHYKDLHDKKATNWMFRQAKREICFVSLILQYLNAVYPSPLGEESVESTSKEGSN